ncbi:MAG: EAL domain-containing protein [Clostridiaceae bacterium]
MNSKLKVNIPFILGVLSAMMFITAIISYSFVAYTSRITEEFYSHPFTVSNTALRLKHNLYQIDQNMMQVSMVHSNSEIAKRERSVHELEYIIDSDFQILKEQYFGDPDTVTTSVQLFQESKQIRGKFFQLYANGEQQEASDLLSQGALYPSIMVSIGKNINTIVDFSQQKAMAFLNQAKEHKDRGFIFIVSSLIGLLTFSLLMIKKALKIDNQLRKMNVSLDHLVKEKTAQLMALNNTLHLKNAKLNLQQEELTAQQEELAAQNEELTAQQEELRSLNEELDHTNWGLSILNENLEDIVHERTDDLFLTNQELIEINKKLQGKNELIQKMAYYDDLTGFPNKQKINEYLIQSIELEKAEGVVLFIDLDDLKLFNDSYGHNFGDKIIKESGARIDCALQAEKIVSRIHGDEFIAVIPGKYRQQQVKDMVQNILHEINKEYWVDEICFHISASIGIAMYPNDGHTAEDIVKNADNAMYAAKYSGKNCWKFFNAEMQFSILNRIQLTNSLRKAIEREELFIHYQPQVNISTEKIIGFEALLRWNSREYGHISPKEFIPIAEQSNLIYPIGKWVLYHACAFASKFADYGLQNTRIAVNISSHQLNSANCIEIIQGIVQQTHIFPHQLELEITESEMLLSVNDAVKKMNQIKELGISLALDDFGTGYSSLTYLQSLPIDTLKIDKTFIEKVTSTKNGSHIIRYIIKMAHLLGLNVVAEGVETLLQVSRLKANQCDIMQGYFFSRPVSEAEAIKMMTGETDIFLKLQAK